MSVFEDGRYLVSVLITDYYPGYFDHGCWSLRICGLNMNLFCLDPIFSGVKQENPPLGEAKGYLEYETPSVRLARAQKSGLIVAKEGGPERANEVFGVGQIVDRRVVSGGMVYWVGDFGVPIYFSPENDFEGVLEQHAYVQIQATIFFRIHSCGNAIVGSGT